MSTNNNDSRSLSGRLWENVDRQDSGEGAGGRRDKARVVTQRDLEYALVLLLVELATCDDGFDEPERYAITNGMARLFGTVPSDVAILISRAQHTLNSFRSTTKASEILRQHLTQDQRHEIMAIIDNVIHADGKTDGFEMFHRHKFARLLDITIDPPPPLATTKSDEDYE